MVATTIEGIGLYFLLFLFFFVLISTIIYTVILLHRKKKHGRISARVDELLKARSCIEPYCSRFGKKKEP